VTALLPRKSSNKEQKHEAERTRARSGRVAGRQRSAGAEQQRSLPVGNLQPGKYQPRTQMDNASLEELAASIRAQGLMQPILVRPIGDALGEDRFEIIAGERRWRAAQMAGLTEVPTLIREIPDESALAMALIENIQRENLNPLEEAQGLQRLIDEFSMTHQEAADAVGRSRPAASNLLRLLATGAAGAGLADARRNRHGSCACCRQKRLIATCCVCRKSCRMGLAQAF
jgi:ParB family chromosome partitioning protein